MKGEEAGPPVVVGGGAAAPSGGAAPCTPRDVLSVCGGRGTAGGTAASRGAPARAASAPARAPVRPALAPALVVCIQRGPFPSCEARPLEVARPRKSTGGSARDALVVSGGEEEYEDDVDVN